jgi:hypothetical protein
VEIWGKLKIEGETRDLLRNFPWKVNTQILVLAIDLLNCDSSRCLYPVVEAADSGEDCWITLLTTLFTAETDDSDLDLFCATGDCQRTAAVALAC